MEFLEVQKWVKSSKTPQLPNGFNRSLMEYNNTTWTKRFGGWWHKPPKNPLNAIEMATRNQSISTKLFQMLAHLNVETFVLINYWFLESRAKTCQMNMLREHAWTPQMAVFVANFWSSVWKIQWPTWKNNKKTTETLLPFLCIVL